MAEDYSVSTSSTGLSSLRDQAPAGLAHSASIPDADVQRFSGGFYVFRLKRNGAKHQSLRRRVGGNPMPWFRHATLEEAETEAARLNAQFPECTFLIMQEVSRVKAASKGA
jgi:hypothetical protein